MRAKPLLPLIASLLLTAAAGCGSDPDPPGPQPEGGDGKYHPETNGVHTTETAACDALVAAYDAKRVELGCMVATSRTCPSFVRAQVGGTACMEYDQGSVDGCIAYYQEPATCEALGEAVETCAVTAYPGTEPAGCPMTP